MKLKMLTLLRGLFLCNVLVHCRYISMFNDRIPWMEAHGRCLSLGGHMASYVEIEPYLDDIDKLCDPPASFWIGNFTINTPILQFEGYLNDTAVRGVADGSQVFKTTSLEQCALMCGEFPSFTVSDTSCLCLTSDQERDVTGGAKYSIIPKRGAKTLLYKYYDKTGSTSEKCVLEFCKASVSEDVKSSSPEVEECSFPVEVNSICSDSLTTNERRQLSALRKSWRGAHDFCQNRSHGGLIGKLSIDNCRQLRLVYGDSIMNTYLWTSIKSYHKSFSAIDYQFSAEITVPKALYFSWLEHLDLSVSSSSYSPVNRFGFFCATDKQLHNVSSSCDLDLTALRSPPYPPVIRTDDLKVADAGGMEWKTVIIVVAVIIFIVIICLIVKLIVYSRRSKSDRKEKDKLKVTANGYHGDDPDDFSDDTRLMEVDTSNKANDTMNSILVEMKSLNDSRT